MAIEFHRKFGLLELTVIEYLSDINTIHVHCKQKINLNDLAHRRLFFKHLIAYSGVLKNKAHRLYYVVPSSFCTIISLDDNIISIEVFFEWFYRNVNNLYAVIMNHTTSDYEKVSCILINITT